MSRTPEKHAKVSVELTVPFHDVDPLHIVWHGNYLKYLEIARTELMRSRGLDIPQIVELGFRQVVIEVKCRYAHPLRYGERFRVDAWFNDIEHRLNIGFEIFNLSQEGQRALHGHCILVTTDAAGRMLLETPPALCALLGEKRDV